MKDFYKHFLLVLKHFVRVVGWFAMLADAFDLEDSTGKKSTHVFILLTLSEEEEAEARKIQGTDNAALLERFRFCTRLCQSRVEKFEKETEGEEYNVS